MNEVVEGLHKAIGLHELRVRRLLMRIKPQHKLGALKDLFPLVHPGMVREGAGGGGVSRNMSCIPPSLTRGGYCRPGRGGGDWPHPTGSDGIRSPVQGRDEEGPACSPAGYSSLC